MKTSFLNLFVLIFATVSSCLIGSQSNAFMKMKCGNFVKSYTLTVDEKSAVLKEFNVLLDQNGCVRLANNDEACPDVIGFNHVINCLKDKGHIDLLKHDVSDLTQMRNVLTHLGAKSSNAQKLLLKVNSFLEAKESQLTQSNSDSELSNSLSEESSSSNPAEKLTKKQRLLGHVFTALRWARHALVFSSAKIWSFTQFLKLSK